MGFTEFGPFSPSCSEEREEEEQQKLKDEQHDLPASGMQSPGNCISQCAGCSMIVLGFFFHIIGIFLLQ